MRHPVFTHLFALHTLFLEQHHDRRKTDEDVHELHEPWPSANKGFDEVPIKEPDESPVDASHP